jgi:hypothetical protein
VRAEYECLKTPGVPALSRQHRRVSFPQGPGPSHHLRSRVAVGGEGRMEPRRGVRVRSGRDGAASRREGTLFDDLSLETLDKRDHVALFGLGHLKLR